jgi:hypothetical protein
VSCDDGALEGAPLSIVALELLNEEFMKLIRVASSWILCAAMAGFFLYGMVRFPDNPIHPCAQHGYCGKQGQPHTAQDFQAFSQWETVMMYWPAGFFALVLLNRTRLREQAEAKFRK